LPATLICECRGCINGSRGKRKNYRDVEIIPRPIVKNAIGSLEKIDPNILSKAATFLASQAVDGSSNTDKAYAKPT
jgi:hypothetical protein